jgi:hypothetical protein
MKKVFHLLINAAMLIFAPVASAISDAELQKAMEAKLNLELGDPEASRVTAEFLMKEVLTWNGETLPVRQADSIVAYAFGNRILPNGNQIPGDMNKQLADVVVSLYEQTEKPVYAQWEVAQEVGDRIPPKHLHFINPIIGDDGIIVYLGTIDVAKEAIRMAGGSKIMGKTLVVGFREHSLRCLNLSRDLGMDAYMPAGVDMPSRYDPKSGQPWTRNRATFIFHEIRTRAQVMRGKMIKQQP